MTAVLSFVKVYSNRLSINSPTFIRPYGDDGTYYPYEALQLIIRTSGTYSLRSYGSMDTYGCLYQLSFDSSDRWQNLLTCNDDSAGDGQFLISRSLQYSSTYILVVTTYLDDDIGNYSIGAQGPALLSVFSITPVESEPLSIYSNTIVK